MSPSSNMAGIAVSSVMRILSSADDVGVNSYLAAQQRRAEGVGKNSEASEATKQIDRSRWRDRRLDQPV